MLIHVRRWKSVPENYILWARVVMWLRAEVAKLADAQDLKSCGSNGPCGFDSRPRYHSYPMVIGLNGWVV